MTPVFSVHPDTTLLEGKTAYRFTFTALSQKPGAISETLTCLEMVGNDRKGSQVLKTEIKGEFVAPLLQMSKTTLDFKFVWDNSLGYADFPLLTKPLTVTNVSPLNVKFHLKVIFVENVDDF